MTKMKTKEYSKEYKQIKKEKEKIELQIKEPEQKK